MGIARVYRYTTALLPKLLPKPSFGVTFLFLESLSSERLVFYLVFWQWSSTLTGALFIHSGNLNASNTL